MTPSEGVVWKLVRNRRLRGLKFRRQHEFLGFILDFYCAERRIVIEIDGDAHMFENAEYDVWRDSILSEWGIHVLRVSSATALHHAEFVERDLIRAVDRILGS
jgi:very-short-patch-repair endonuclease